MPKNKLIGQMVEMQNQLNKMIDADWKDKGSAWHRAVWVECAECMDHLAYKWWKKQDVNMEQVQMELVDIWHFLLSWAIQDKENISFLVDGAIFYSDLHDKTDLSDSIELLAMNAAGRELEYSINHFVWALPLVDMDIESLFKMYAGKYTLNAFRQDDGYKDGTYRKQWHDGREDNEHLTAILKAMSTIDDDFVADVYAALSDRYQVEDE
jgi:dimeric dUTPase (all-alpha-NTP-PPase superfamily)